MVRCKAHGGIQGPHLRHRDTDGNGSAYGLESRLRGDADAVLSHPGYWAPDGLDQNELRRLRVAATTPVFVDHSAPRPDPIPFAPGYRRNVIHRRRWDLRPPGQVFRDGHKLVKAHRQLFHRPPMPLKAA